MHNNRKNGHALANRQPERPVIKCKQLAVGRARTFRKETHRTTLPQILGALEQRLISPDIRSIQPKIGMRNNSALANHFVSAFKCEMTGISATD